jgi:uncharacterized protein YukE
MVEGAQKAEAAAEAAADVVVGIAEALDTSAGGGDAVKTCIADAKLDFSAVQTAVNDFETAWKKKSLDAFSAAFSALASVVAEFKSAMAECSRGNATLLQEVEALEAQLKQPHGWLRVLKSEGLKIFHHEKDITADCQSIWNDAKMKPTADWSGVGTGVGKILAIMLAADTPAPKVEVLMRWPWQKKKPAAPSAAEQAAEQIAEHVSAFVVAAAEALDAQMGAAGAVKQCLGDARAIEADIEATVGDFKAAFNEKSADKLEAAFTTMSKVVSDFASALTKCRSDPAVAGKVEALAKALKQPHGLVKVVKGEALTVWRNRKDMTADCKAVYGAFEAKPANFGAAGTAVGKIVAILLQPTLVELDAEAIGARFVGNELATPHYEDPNATGSCQAGEVDVQIQGIKGKMCAPQCSSSGACPTDVPAGVTAKPTCALQGMGGKYCALVCSPSTEGKRLRAGDAQCGAKASCKAISGVGICTYDA